MIFTALGAGPITASSISVSATLATAIAASASTGGTAREKILRARHEAWRVFRRRNRKRETLRPVAFAGECSTAWHVWR